MESRLLVDLGGTHLRCALQCPGGEAFAEREVRCADWPGPGEAIADYLRQRPEQVTRGAICVAAPVTGDPVRMTNRAWSFSARELAEQVGLSELRVVNDFTAMAMSLPFLPPDGIRQIGAGTPATGAAVAVLGPGTGLGVSGLVPLDGRWVALASEGGHVTLPAVDERETAVISVLRRRMDHVSAERLVSGFGLTNLHAALQELAGQPAAQPLPAEQITARARAGDGLAAEALELFFAFLGTVAGDLALTLGARGGVYVAGGIARRLEPELAASRFRQRFEAKGRYGDYLRGVPTWLITEANPAFRGLAAILDGRMASG
ncbi:MAG: glucokinase [Gammaproteobacteria bacterium]